MKEISSFAVTGFQLGKCFNNILSHIIVYIVVMLPEKIRRAYNGRVVRLSVPHSFPGHNIFVCGWIKIVLTDITRRRGVRKIPVATVKVTGRS